ncbi:hypothetical protein [Frankia sp. Cj3]|uniref:hypothetical protein n=1 Tax=Frankia sp. Cj3 TaxID=2880976 RepID=UPI001EF55579|nr:hypothetical protein [Frankia sp. Cj3]
MRWELRDAGKWEQAQIAVSSGDDGAWYVQHTGFGCRRFAAKKSAWLAVRRLMACHDGRWEVVPRDARPLDPDISDNDSRLLYIDNGHSLYGSWGRHRDRVWGRYIAAMENGSVLRRTDKHPKVGGSILVHEYIDPVDGSTRYTLDFTHGDYQCTSDYGDLDTAVDCYKETVYNNNDPDHPYVSSDLDVLVRPLRTGPSIEEVLDQFLAEQRARLSERTMSKYEGIVSLLGKCIARESEDGLLSSVRDDPETIPDHLGGFLGYYMVRKVIARKGEIKAAGTVAGKLVSWLSERGYIDGTTAKNAVDSARDTGRGLAAAYDFRDLIDDHLDSRPPVDISGVPAGDRFEDYAFVAEVSPGRISFDAYAGTTVGPMDIPVEISNLVQPEWSMYVEAARIDGAWHLLMIGSVFP